MRRRTRLFAMSVLVFLLFTAASCMTSHGGPGPSIPPPVATADPLYDASTQQLWCRVKIDWEGAPDEMQVQQADHVTKRAPRLRCVSKGKDYSRDLLPTEIIELNLRSDSVSMANIYLGHAPAYDPADCVVSCQLSVCVEERRGKGFCGYLPIKFP